MYSGLVQGFGRGRLAQRALPCIQAALRQVQQQGQQQRLGLLRRLGRVCTA